MTTPRKIRTKRSLDPCLAGLTRLAYTVRETAAMLGVSDSTVLQWIHQQKLRAIQKGTGTSRRHFTVPLSSIQEFLSATNSVR
jgi:excisionase family DNA binding protein